MLGCLAGGALALLRWLVRGSLALLGRWVGGALALLVGALLTLGGFVRVQIELERHFWGQLYIFKYGLRQVGLWRSWWWVWCNDGCVLP